MDKRGQIMWSRGAITADAKHQTVTVALTNKKEKRIVKSLPPRFSNNSNCFMSQVLSKRIKVLFRVDIRRQTPFKYT